MSESSPKSKYVVYFVLGMLSGVMLTATVVFLAFDNGTAPKIVNDVNQRTLLFDPRANEGLTIIGTPMADGFIGNRPVGNPRWVIIGKVKPTIFGNSQGATYSYLDAQSGQFDGPYVPDVPVMRP